MHSHRQTNADAYQRQPPSQYRCQTVESRADQIAPLHPPKLICFCASGRNNPWRVATYQSRLNIKANKKYVPENKKAAVGAASVRI